MTSTFATGNAALDRLLLKLQGVQARADGYTACCPAHDDQNPSLSIAVSDKGHLLVKCWAGCKVEQVVAAVGLEMRDLMSDAPAPPPQTRKHKRSGFHTLQAAASWMHKKIGGGQLTTYVYRDDSGRDVGAVLRFDLPGGKQIRQVITTDDSWTFRGLPAPRPLYRLPELLASDPNELVVFVEGEKCVEACVALGFLSTTSQQGAKSPELTDFSPLRGRRVVIMPDQDKAGRSYRDAAAKLMRAAGVAIVSVLELPDLKEGEDVFDWAQARHSAGKTRDEVIAELRELLATAKEPPAGEPTTTEASDQDEHTRAIGSKRCRVEVLRHDGYVSEQAPPRNRGTKALAAPPALPSDKPKVLVPGEQNGVRVGNDEFVAEVLKALPEGVLYRRDSIVGELVGERGRVRFEEANENRARSIIDANVQLEFWQWSESLDEYELHYRPCSRDLAGVFLATAAKASNLRELRAIVRHPVFGRDFNLVQPGWNEQDGIFYDEPVELEGLQPCTEKPLDVLDDLVTDFPFRDDAARENAFGMLLTPLCAHAIRGNIPLHLVYASIERTGKGLLIDTLLGITALGEEGVPTMQLGRTEEEREKRITSAIIQGTTVVHFDNLPSEELLDSPSLASLATSRIWRGRPLGHSRIIQLPNTLIPVFSGNNPKATGELTKRTVPIPLQPRNDRPEDRADFVHSDVRAYAREHRRDVLAAALGMVIAWRDAGCPPPPSTIRMGGFEEWVRVVGGILHHNGATDWMTNYAAWVRAGDEFAADAIVLVEHWWKTRGPAEVKPAEILAMVKQLEVFPRVTAGLESGSPIRLARQVLGPLENRPVAGRIVKRRAHGNASRYSLSEVTA